MRPRGYLLGTLLCIAPVSCTSGSNASSGSEEPPPVQRAIAELEAVRDSVCACTGPDCDQRATDQMAEWAKKWRGLQAPKAESARVEAVSMEIAECEIRNAMGSASNSVASLEVIEAAACACTDDACRTKAQEDFAAWAKKHIMESRSPADDTRVDGLAAKIRECVGGG